MIGGAVMPGWIIATTALSITDATGKEGWIDPELGPRRRPRRDAGDGTAWATTGGLAGQITANPSI